MLNFIRGLVFLDLIICRRPISHLFYVSTDWKTIENFLYWKMSERKPLSKSTWEKAIYGFLCKPEKLGSGLSSIFKKITAILVSSICLR